MVRIGAVGDVHVRPGSAAALRPRYERVADDADLLLLAGDITDHGSAEEAAEAAEVFGGLGVPVVAVLGNHDHHSGAADVVTKALRDVGVTVLEAGATVVDAAAGVRVGVVGATGSGGGFAGLCVHSHGEAAMKAVAAYVERTASGLRSALDELGRDADVVVAVTHYAPVRDTLLGEPLELYPMLGSHLLAAAVDGDPIDGYLGSRHRPDLVLGAGTERGDRHRVALHLHGHAHYGSECGTTPGGTPVRNVAAPLVGGAYAVYRLPDLARLG